MVLPRTSNLTNKQQGKLREHSKRYTMVHIANMKRRMNKGMSFTAAHAEVMKLKIQHLKTTHIGQAYRY